MKGYCALQVYVTHIKINRKFMDNKSVGLQSVGIKWVNESISSKELIRASTEKIQTVRERLKVAQDRQKSYVDTR